jgi:hypothetical protein
MITRWQKLPRLPPTEKSGFICRGRSPSPNTSETSHESAEGEEGTYDMGSERPLSHGFSEVHPVDTMPENYEADGPQGLMSGTVLRFATHVISSTLFPPHF